MGSNVAVADFNGDGYPDLAAGAPGEDRDGVANAGSVYVFLGSVRGLQPWLVLDDSAHGGPFAEARFGAYLHAADVDADGTSDLFVAYGGAVTDAPVFRFGGTSSGLSFRQLWRQHELSPTGSGADAGLGRAWASGDFDGDGDVDVAVAAPAHDGGGVVALLENVNGTLFYDAALQPGAAGFGQSLDVTAAGLLIVGSPDAAEVRTYADGVLQQTSSSTAAMAAFGDSVRGGDLDGDGVDEIFVGGEEDFVELAGEAVTIAVPYNDPTPGPARPLEVADLNEDGHADLVLAYHPGDSAQRLFVLEGDGTLSRSCWAASASTPCWFELSPDVRAQDDRLVESTAVVDLDGDLHLDLVVGAPGSWDGRGLAYVYRPSAPTEWSSALGITQLVTQETGLSSACQLCETYPDGTICSGSGDMLCREGSCVPRGCGDLWREPGPDPARESCDDGNTVGGDACSSTCESVRLVISSRAMSEDSPSRLSPAVAEDGRGDLLFVYTADTGESRELRARRYSALGAAREADDESALVLTADLGVGWDPQASVAGSSAGGWIVAWTDPVADGDGAGVAMRRILADGTLGPARIANRDGRGSQSDPAVATVGDGFVVAWTDQPALDAPLGSSVVEARRFGADDLPVEDEWVVSAPERRSSQPAVVSAGVRWMIAWAQEDAGSGSSVRGQRFGGEVDETVSFLLAEQGDSAALAHHGEQFFAAWVSRAADHLGDIQARAVPLQGATAGAAVDITVTDPLEPRRAELAPSIAEAGGGFLVAYEQDGYRRGLAYAQVDGPALPPEAADLTTYLGDGQQGDVTLLRTSRGVWFAWSDATAYGDPAAYRSFLAFLLPLD